MATGAGCGSSGEPGSGGSGGTTGTGGDGTGGGSTTASSSSSTTSTSSSTTASSSSGGCAPTGVDVGTADKYTTDGLHKVSATKVLVGRDGGGLFARSSLCTHMSCNLNTFGTLIASGIRCTCHGAEYDTTGKVTMGPATKELKSYKLTQECDGTLRVDTLTEVDPAERLVV
ncbi:Chitinase [Minicystis rosea]|nr:Chitinase [Minicystis rosea]